MLNVGKLHLFQVYPMRSSPRGYFFMINNIQFVNNIMDARTGAEVDERNLEDLFTQFGYIVEKHRDEGLEVGTFCTHNMIEGICMCTVAPIHDQWFWVDMWCHDQRVEVETDKGCKVAVEPPEFCL